MKTLHAAALLLLPAATTAAAVVAGQERRAASVTKATTTAVNIKSFEGVEEPTVRFLPASATFAKDDFANITDQGDNTVRMTLRYRKGDWWDGDRATKNTDRQRAEVKGLGPHQKDGETFEYGTTWRTNPSFRGANRFCHVFQLKATDGDNGAPLVVLSVLPGTETAAVRYCSGDAKGFTVARTFAWKPGAWQTVRIRIKTSAKGDGEVSASVEGDAFKGVRSVAVFRPRATDYRPKWGLYRGVTKDMPIGDDYVEHRNAAAARLP